MAKNWQEIKKSLVQLVFYPFLALISGIKKPDFRDLWFISNHIVHTTYSSSFGLLTIIDCTRQPHMTFTLDNIYGRQSQETYLSPKYFLTIQGSRAVIASKACRVKKKSSKNGDLSLSHFVFVFCWNQHLVYFVWIFSVCCSFL